MKNYRALILTGLFAAAFGFADAQTVSVVNTSLGNDLKRVFPELSEGYIDLNANNRLDRLEDMDELIAETLVQDGKLQVQEVLDFILEQFRFFPIEKLRQIQGILDNAEGDIAEIIALTYKNRFADIIEQKREFGSNDLYLTPSALRRAHEEMSGYIATMLHAFRKEERQFEQSFSDARESLFSMIEAGYPLPPMGAEDRELLVSAMVHTIIGNDRSNPARVKAAIGTLGRLKAESSLPYLQDLLGSSAYRADSARALGEIGNTQARSILMESLRASSEGEYQYALIRSLGKIGGDESAEYILGMLSEEVPEGETDADGGIQTRDPEKVRTILKSLSDMAQQGSQNRQIYTVLSEYLSSPDPQLRIIAVEGISGFGARSATGKLLPLVKDEENEQVKISLVRSLNSLNDPATIPVFIGMLQDPAASTTLRIELIEAIGANTNGPRAVLNIMEFLSSQDETIREATRESLLKLYRLDPASVIGGLSRGALQSQDPRFLEEATGIMAELSDPSSVNTLLRLLEIQYPQVRRNVTWAFYRIRPKDNVRVAAEMQKIVSSEAEPLAVRTNAVRALGAMGLNSPQLEVHKTLLTTLKLKSPEYSMLRFFSIQELGKIGEAGPEVIEGLLKSASPQEEEHIRLAALQALRNLGVAGQDYAETVAGLAKRSTDIRIQLEALRVLGDMASPQAVLVAAQILESREAAASYPEIAYALSRVRTPEAVEMLIDMTSGPEQRSFIMGLLEEMGRDTLGTVVNRRVQTEKDPAIKAMLAELQTVLDTSD